jgi:hypothetical protein
VVHNLKIDPIFGCNGWLFLNQLILVRKFQSIKEMKEPMTKTLKWIAVASVFDEPCIAQGGGHKANGRQQAQLHAIGR